MTKRKKRKEGKIPTTTLENIFDDSESEYDFEAYEESEFSIGSENFSDDEFLSPNSLKCGDFVVVIENKKSMKTYSIGEITEIIEHEIELDYYQRNEPYLKFSKTEVCYIYEKHDIERVLPKPLNGKRFPTNRADNSAARYFVTVPRFQAGSPIALGIVSNKSRNGNPILTPYPSWDWHMDPKKCKVNRIVSVYRTMIDECGRLWVLDTGRFIDDIVCPPQIMAFDLKTDQLLYRYELPASQYEPRSIFVTPAVEILSGRNQCKNTFIYLADCQAFSIVVYDLQRQTSWRVTDKTFYPYPNYGTFNIQGDSFELMDGVLGMSLNSASTGSRRKLFYHAMSSPTESWVYTEDLRNGTRFSGNPSSSPEIFHTFQRGRGTQSAAEAINKDGILFFGLMSDVKIACFNTNKDGYGDSTSTNIIADNPVTLQFASGMKVIKNGRGIEELFILTSRFQKVATGTLNASDINFRIVRAEVDSLIRGRNCAVNGRENEYVSVPHHVNTGSYGFKPPRVGY
ncbi:hypothetical protein JTB14_026090 [Gonioctena quinquepunctata]|nr:hypothetical protein JTB14_026090 [Gonioctena quinquepunctata]